MDLRNAQRIELPATADMHVHLRQGDMMELVAPTITSGGVDTVFVMPNLVPPITTVAAAASYRRQLRAANPNVEYLMSLFLHPTVTPEVIDAAAAAAASSGDSVITGVKLYPQGATTNSDGGVADLEAYYPVFEAMQRHDMVLNLHGEALEVPTPPTTLEEAFLPTLARLHARFPRLRIVLEHCTTAAAVAAVEACGPTVGATITAHHLYLTSADACRDPLAYCKPVPKRAVDRDALVRAAVGGSAKFFFGSDSAPHPIGSKTGAATEGRGEGRASQPPAGVFTQPFATQLVVLALEEALGRGAVAEGNVTRERLEGFLSRNGRAFYGLPQTGRRIVLERGAGASTVVPRSIGGGDVEVGVSRHGEEVFGLRWL